jgi:hypothetical protein
MLTTNGLELLSTPILEPPLITHADKSYYQHWFDNILSIVVFCVEPVWIISLFLKKNHNIHIQQTICIYKYSCSESEHSTCVLTNVSDILNDPNACTKAITHKFQFLHMT